MSRSRTKPMQYKCGGESKKQEVINSDFKDFSQQLNSKKGSRPRKYLSLCWGLLLYV